MMKKWIAAGALFTMLFCSTFIVAANPSGTIVRLPTQFVTMRAVDGSESWFEMTLSNISAGFDVVTGQYLGWCVQKDTEMTRAVNHRVLLYSSYDPAMPQSFVNSNWDKVNYLINHKNGSRRSIQNVIWNYICGDSIPTDDIHAMAMRADADAFGTGFVPQPGQKIAILVDVINSVYSIQRTFFELTLPSKVPLGDLVWNDYNANGIQDPGEPGIPGVTVQMYNPSGELVGTSVTNIHGYYSFANFVSGNYFIQFVLPPGYRFSPARQGTDETKDSDADPLTGRTPLIVCDPLASDTSWDAGMYRPVDPGNPNVTVPQPEPDNIPPTADATAGEPYSGLIGEEIYFNGSRSYDRDGRIVSWVWSFGDGNGANGSLVTHVYTTEGTYTVLLTVTDDDGATDTYSTVARVRLPNRPPLKPSLSGPTQGNRNVSYVFALMTTDPDGDNIRYIIYWGDGLQNISAFIKSGRRLDLAHQWSSFGFYTVQVCAQDQSNATSEMHEVVIAIDVRYVADFGYLINTNGKGPFDVFYSNVTKSYTQVMYQSNWVYLIDTDGDGILDHQLTLSPGSESLRPYPEALDMEYVLLLIGLGLVIIFIVVFWFLSKRKKNKTLKQSPPTAESLGDLSIKNH